MIAGETLSYFHERALEVHGDDTPVLVMGDFNDEPFDVSLVTHALSTRQRAKVTQGDSPRLWNLMSPVIGRSDGTYWYGGFASVFDQFLVNKNMIGDDRVLNADPNSVAIVRCPGMAKAEPYPAPIAFGGMGKPVNLAGFSDHLPITLEATEKD